MEVILNFVFLFSTDQVAVTQMLLISLKLTFLKICIPKIFTLYVVETFKVWVKNIFNSVQLTLHGLSLPG